MNNLQCAACYEPIERFEYYLDINGLILHESCCFEKYSKHHDFEEYEESDSESIQ